MSKMLYLKMAFDNIRKNQRIYMPFLLTCIGTGAMYYIIRALSLNESIARSHGGEAVLVFLELGRWIMVVFSVIFLYYTYSFWIKQRKKEFGLYTILGMEKRHLRRVLFWENLMSYGIGLGGGVVLGIVLFKAILLLLMRILHFEIVFGFEIPMEAIRGTAFLLGGIYLLIFLNTLRIIHMTNPIDLLKGGQTGEKEPRTRWFLALAGFLLLGGGYYLALATKSPLEAFLLFFVAVIMVILGTYALFTAGSILILKILRKKKSYYYRTNHFTAVSGMIYRMKQNAAGLASICVISTGVLLLISVSVSLYFGMEELIRTRYPRNVTVIVDQVSGEEREELEQSFLRTVDENECEAEKLMNYLDYRMLMERKEDNLFVGQENVDFQGVSSQMIFISLEDYNRITGKKQSLQKGEVLLQETRGEIAGEEFEVENKTYRIKERINDIDMGNRELAMVVDTYYVVLPSEEDLLQLEKEQRKDSSGIDTQQGFEYFFGFDVDEGEQKQLDLVDGFIKQLDEIQKTGYVESEAESRGGFYTLYGSIFFIGIFLGILFLMATVLIIYYKQMSEGYEDHDRFVIMQKVGMSREEVKKSIQSQVMTVFFLPLAMAGIHVCFAFPILKEILGMMNLSDTRLFAVGTISTFLVFAVIYVIVYAMTARVYYRLVSWKE